MLMLSELKNKNRSHHFANRRYRLESLHRWRTNVWFESLIQVRNGDPRFHLELFICELPLKVVRNVQEMLTIFSL